MKKNEILKIYGTEYKDMTISLLEQSDLISLINKRINANVRSKTPVIGIKPNILAASKADTGATTHPEVVEGIIVYLKAHGDFDIRIMEGAWVGDYTEKAFRVCGYEKLAQKHEVTLIDTQKDSSHKVDCKGLAISICDCMSGVDFFINVPVLKGHCQTRITCALKNMKGIIPNSEKRRFHSLGLHKPIAHLNTAITQDFIVVDHICGDLDFEDGGNPVIRNCIMTSRDPVLTDAYVCGLLGYRIEDVGYVGLADKLGVGSSDLLKARIAVYDMTTKSTLVLSPEMIFDEKVPDTRKILELNDVVNEVESCSACYGYLIPALERLKEEGSLENLRQKLTSKICIGQGYSGKSGKIGVGNCTSRFDFSIKGCPPTEEEIYTSLKEYMKQ